MIYRRRTMRFIQLSWITTKPGRAWVGSISNKHNPSTKSGIDACISSRITTVIHVVSNHQINYNCFNEPFAVSPYKNLYWDMHGLIFETSIWLLAGSTRFVHWQLTVMPCFHDTTEAIKNFFIIRQLPCIESERFYRDFFISNSLDHRLAST